MDRRYYHTGELARRAAVSVRTLRFYDRAGLLSPSGYSEAGYRLYTDADLIALQQILALKFLGFSLGEIKGYLQAGPEGLAEALARQKAMLREKRAQINAVLRAIDRAEQLARTESVDWHAITKLIEVIQMDQKNDWVSKYFTPEQRATMEDLSKRAYSEEARHRLEARGEWTEADQRRVDGEYAALAAELKRLVVEGQDPASPAAQALARRQIDLLQQFTQGDAEIEAGLRTWWKEHDALPAESRPGGLPWSEQEGSFLQQAMAIYRRNQNSGA